MKLKLSYSIFTAFFLVLAVMKAYGDGSITVKYTCSLKTPLLINITNLGNLTPQCPGFSRSRLFSGSAATWSENVKSSPCFYSVTGATDWCNNVYAGSTVEIYTKGHVAFIPYCGCRSVSGK